jgi:hypothetical protein
MKNIGTARPVLGCDVQNAGLNAAPACSDLERGCMKCINVSLEYGRLIVAVLRPLVQGAAYCVSPLCAHEPMGVNPRSCNAHELIIKLSTDLRTISPGADC